MTQRGRERERECLIGCMLCAMQPMTAEGDGLFKCDLYVGKQLPTDAEEFQVRLPLQNTHWHKLADKER